MTHTNTKKLEMYYMKQIIRGLEEKLNQEENDESARNMERTIILLKCIIYNNGTTKGLDIHEDDLKELLKMGYIKDLNEGFNADAEKEYFLKMMGVDTDKVARLLNDEKNIDISSLTLTDDDYKRLTDKGFSLGTITKVTKQECTFTRVYNVTDMQYPIATLS
jgi:hypothetical protein